MVSRTTRTIAHFPAAFWIAALGEEVPAGEYRVDHEWTLLEGGTQHGYMRTGSFIHLPSLNIASRVQQLVSISPTEFGQASETACPS